MKTTLTLLTALALLLLYLTGRRQCPAVFPWPNDYDRLAMDGEMLARGDGRVWIEVKGRIS